MKYLKNLTIAMLLMFTASAGYGSEREFKATYCGVNTYGGLTLIDTDRIFTLCLGRAISPLNEGYDAVKIGFGDGSTAIYEVDDVEYLSETQKNIYVYRNNGPLQELTVTFRRSGNTEHLISVRGKIEHSDEFYVYLTAARRAVTETECPYGVGIDGSSGRYISCQCPADFPYFNAESGMCQLRD